MDSAAVDEQRRLAALRSYQILDSETESSFDRIAHTAARIFHAPIAFLSLVDENRQWFKACVGYVVDGTSRDVSFCSHALMADDVMVVPDALADVRFATNPLVTGEPHIRFYAGAPLITPEGYRLGTLCVIDREPRPGLDHEQQRVLRELAALVMDLLEMRKQSLEQQEAESRLDEEIRLLSRLVNSSVDAILTWDRSHVITTWNKAAEKLYGYARDEIVGRSITTLIPPHLQGEEREILARVVGGDSIDHYETQRVAKDGRLLDVALSASPVIGLNGDLMAVAVIARDIGPMIKAEAAARIGREMAERANLAKSEFLSRMSHELRTPLNAILGFGQLLELEDLTEDQAENVAEMIRGGRHLLELINEILDISRIETGRLALSVEPVPVGYVIDEATALVRPLASARGITLSVAASDPHLHMMADQQRLKQILINLLSNAIKYNRDGGAVSVSSSASGDGRVVLSVTDTGAGIRPDQIEAMFTPFERLGAETSHVEGTGLGLAISRRLAEAMGGSLGVQSAVGRGSTFSLDLAEATHPGATALWPEPPPTELQTPSVILYVEDNVSNLLLVDRIIGRTPDVRLVACSLGAEAVETAARERPDLILLDLNLPDMSGQEVLHRLQLDPLTADIPVVVLSADATQGQIRRLLQLGARAYLTKPFDVPAFNKVIEDVLAERRSESLLAEDRG